MKDAGRNIPLPQYGHEASGLRKAQHEPHDDRELDPARAMALRGRGAGINPGNRFATTHPTVSGDYLDALRAEGSLAGDGSASAPMATMVLDDNSRTVLNPVDSPDLNFKWTLNAYRGCEHGCVYCYARPGHEYLGLSCGVDFESKIFAKRHAPELLRRELTRKSWKGETIAMSGVTDCYQPVERELMLTRRCLEVLLEFRQSVTIVTKSRLILRDLDLLGEMARHSLVHAAVSITTLDARLAATMEPRAASPKARLDTIRTLAHAGVPTGVMVAPIIPALNDHEIPAILREASRAGAGAAGYVLLRLPHQLKEVFLDWLRRSVPKRAAHVEVLLRESRGGELYDSRFGVRQRGTGPNAEALAATFRVFRKKYKLDPGLPHLDTSAFRRPASAEPGQQWLFGEAPA